MTSSSTHLVILPTYNTGAKLVPVVRAVHARWRPVLVVVDGSTDGAGAELQALARELPGLTVIVLAENQGKGAAVLEGARVAQERGFTHALVMDADGQHPEGSVAEFMAVSQRHPGAMILGRPIFPPNIPPERLHGRKLSTGLVRLELFGRGVDDALFGFRVYPLGPLIATLGPRRGGRRYDFDTEAVVRLAWAGVAPINVPAPVRYFSRGEGGVSHFHYVRDNVTLAGMHARLLAELLFRRWPALRRHRKRWRQQHLIGPAVAALLWLGIWPSLVRAQEETPVDPAAWGDLAREMARHPGVTARFVERRHFPFRRTPVVLEGEVRVAAEQGLSLHYTSPAERTVIVDDNGMLVRSGEGETAPPPDPRAGAANGALLAILRFDFASMQKEFEVTGTRTGGEWTLTLVPRDPLLRRGLERIEVEGRAAEVRRIVLQRSARQSVEIEIDPPHDRDGFDEGERAKYFRGSR